MVDRRRRDKHGGQSSILFDPSDSSVRRRIFTERRYAKCGIIRRRVSVCRSVTLWYCIKMAKRRITQIMPHDSPRTVVFCCQKSRRNLNGITPYGGDKCRWGGLILATFDEKRTITRKRYKIDAQFEMAMFPMTLGDP